MRSLIRKHSRWALTIVTTFASILATMILLYVVYRMTDTSIRPTEILVATLAPALIAPTVTWYLFGLLKELDRLASRMRELATYDQLTGLLTRRSFFEQAEHYFRLAIRDKRDFAVVMLDIDHFKKVNDTHGHPGGDEVLREFGETLAAVSRTTDLIGRYGGEEFVAFLWGAETSGAEAFSSKLHEAVAARHVRFNGVRIPFTISIGAAQFSPDKGHQQLEDVVTRADQALYEAKRTGRNKTVIDNAPPKSQSTTE